MTSVFAISARIYFIEAEGKLAQTGLSGLPKYAGQLAEKIGSARQRRQQPQ
jgi:hypothetical protein